MHSIPRRDDIMASLLTWGTTRARTANKPAVGHRHRVMLDDGDQSPTTWHVDMSHWRTTLASRDAVTHVTFHVPFTGRGSFRSNCRSVSMAGQCLRIWRPSSATLTATTGVITVYSTSLSWLQENQRGWRLKRAKVHWRTFRG